MGDVVVITASRSVAAWARRAAHHRGEQGTSLGLTPVIVLLSKDRASTLLDPARPELAIFAVWAGCRGHGPAAGVVAKRALKLTKALPARLRHAQTRAIMAMLSQQLIKEIAMEFDQVPETKASRALRILFEERGEKRGAARGKRELLLGVFGARGLSPTKEERALIAALTDVAVLHQCVLAAVTAASVGAVLAQARTSHRRRSVPARAPTRRPVKKPSRRRAVNKRSSRP
jgi:hypothetical protein